MDNNIKGIDIQLFRTRLKKRLKDCHITQKALAAKIGVSEDTVNMWFRGSIDDTSGNKKHKPPCLENVYKVSQVLGVSIDYFVNPDMDCLTVSKQMIHDYTGLSDAAIECLHGWYQDKLQGGLFGSYYNDIDTLNLILEYYENARKNNKRKKNTAKNIYTLFHYIGSFIHAHKFQRVQQDLIRYGSGQHFTTIEKGDTITKKDTGKSEVIETLCTPVNSLTHSGNDTTMIDIVNTENTSELYNIPVSDLYREHAKSQIIDSLKKIGGIQ